MSKILDEIHTIRKKIYEEEKGLSNKEILDKLHKRVKRIVKERNLDLKQPYKKMVNG